MDTKLQEYAKLLIEVGLNVQKGQTLIISSPVECASFARLCADAAYNAGCREVIMNWSDDYLSRQKFLRADASVFDDTPEYREVLLGHAEVRNVFKITGAGVIAGCYVTDGKVQRNAQVRLLRDNVVVFEGKLSSLKHYKEDVKEMAAGFECGMSLEGHNDIKEGDVVECFIMEEIPR